MIIRLTCNTILKDPKTAPVVWSVIVLLEEYVDKQRVSPELLKICTLRSQIVWASYLFLNRNSECVSTRAVLGSLRVVMGNKHGVHPGTVKCSLCTC